MKSYSDLYNEIVTNFRNTVEDDKKWGYYDCAVLAHLTFMEWYKLQQNKVSVNRYLYHTSNVNNRNFILENGLIPYRGKQWTFNNKCLIGINALFMTNSSASEDWFNSTFDDDIWEIDTIEASKYINEDLMFAKDIEFGLNDENKHVYTLSIIHKKALKLIKKGTGKDLINN